MHWASRYIGLPWVAGESDCWHFARRVWAEVFERRVPVMAVDATDSRAARRAFADQAGWREVSKPQDGDAVLMARGRYPCHVGVWVEPRGVLHSVEGAGVVFTVEPEALGYRTVGIYRPEAECAPM